MTPGGSDMARPTTVDAFPRSVTRMKAHTDPPWAIDRILELETENAFLRLDRDVVAAEDRDRWKRLFNRLDAAISHHKKHTDKLFADTHDEALYKARDRILRDSAEGQG